MPILTTDEFDQEQVLRVASDSLLARWVGTTFDDEAKVVNDAYPNFQPVVDLVQGDDLSNSIRNLDQFKNSKLFVYSPAGSLAIINPRELLFSGEVRVGSVESGKLEISLPRYIEWDTSDTVGAVVSNGDLPDHYFGAGLVVTRKAFWVISSQLNVISDVKLVGRRAKLAYDQSTSKKRVFYGSPDPYEVVVPVGSTMMTVKLWGAGGGNDHIPNKPIGDYWGYGGYGGYTYAKIPVTAGQKFLVMAGTSNVSSSRRISVEWSWVNVGEVILASGFGGQPRLNDWYNAHGGGLTGIFSGVAAITASSRSRAIAVAGGGSGGRCNNTTATNGANGNSSSARTTMAGQGANASGDYNGGGGGGYAGGALNQGGAGFVTLTGTDIQILNDDTSGRSDPDFVSGFAGPAQNGLAVIVFD